MGVKVPSCIVRICTLQNVCLDTDSCSCSFVPGMGTCRACSPEGSAVYPGVCQLTGRLRHSCPQLELCTTCKRSHPNDRDNIVVLVICGWPMGGCNMLRGQKLQGNQVTNGLAHSYPRHHSHHHHASYDCCKLPCVVVVPTLEVVIQLTPCGSHSAVSDTCYMQCTPHILQNLQHSISLLRGQLY